MTRIYLVRHAEAEGNLYRRVQGQYNSLITDNGYRQIEALSRRFADIHIDAVYSSDLFRTCTTAGAVWKPKGLTLQTLPALREVDMGEWEDRTWADVDRTDGEELERFNATDPRWQAPGGENFHQLRERVSGALRDLAARHEGQTIAVFCHGCAIRNTLALFKGLSVAESGGEPHSDNTAVSLLEFEGDTVRIVYQDDNSHLDESISTLARQAWWRAGGEKKLGQRTLWYRPTPQADCVQAMLDDTPVGTLRLDLSRDGEKGIGWITLWSMEPDYCGLGLGIQLLGQAVSTFRPLGRDRLRLCCSPNSAAHKFFARHGFVKVGEEKGADVLEKYIGFEERV